MSCALPSNLTKRNPAVMSPHWSARWACLSRLCQNTFGCFETQEWVAARVEGPAGFTGFRLRDWATSPRGSSRTDECGPRVSTALERHLDTLDAHPKNQEDES
jgi:hypothetical protein